MHQLSENMLRVIYSFWFMGYVQFLIHGICLHNSFPIPYICLQQTEITIPFNLIKQRIFDTYYQSYANINNSNRLSMYSRYKHDFQFESYLDTTHDKKKSRLRWQNFDFPLTT